MIWTTADDATLRSMWAEGKSSKEIGEVLGRSSASILQRRCITGLPARPSRWDEKKTAIKKKRKRLNVPRLRRIPDVTLLKPNKNGYMDSAAVLERLLEFWAA